MLRYQHNEHFNASRTPKDDVYSMTFGYGEISQYDSRCASCWLGHSHNWEKHDASILHDISAKHQHLMETT